MDHTRRTWHLFLNRFSIQHKWGTKKILSNRIPGMHYRGCHIRACIKVRKPGLADEFKTYRELRSWKEGKWQQWKGTYLARNRSFEIPQGLLPLSISFSALINSMDTNRSEKVTLSLVKRKMKLSERDGNLEDCSKRSIKIQLHKKKVIFLASLEFRARKHLKKAHEGKERWS